MLLQGLQDKSLKYDCTKIGHDKESRSRQEVILGPREECCDKRQDVETEKKLQRRILSQHRFICRDTKRRQLLSRQKNNVATRNDCLMN